MSDDLRSETIQAAVHLGERGYTTTATIRGHRVLIDEPRVDDGDDAGPKATELVLAALGACTAITLRMYATRKEWPLTGVDAAVTSRGSGRQRTIDLAITLRGPLDGEQRARLLHVAHACPVHRMLEGGVAINTWLVEG